MPHFLLIRILVFSSLCSRFLETPPNCSPTIHIGVHHHLANYRPFVSYRFASSPIPASLFVHRSCMLFLFPATSNRVRAALNRVLSSLFNLFAHFNPILTFPRNNHLNLVYDIIGLQKQMQKLQQQKVHQRVVRQRKVQQRSPRRLLSHQVNAVRHVRHDSARISSTQSTPTRTSSLLVSTTSVLTNSNLSVLLYVKRAQLC